ncbi:unnamed protein product [Bemisia tabaci]|uniref:SAGA-associated factor 11 n=1 Tax=Bemisia tabaci TaxID=7038 RepID=A0A9N9ZYZ5_BEMTA|nr:PREDICTED: SAGA-associated factor 11 homolog [Bemisia tabaci]CAH0382625.1 unnamed protein product [Bemisia tabaci]
MSEDCSKLDRLKSDFVHLFLQQSETADNVSKYVYDNLLDESILECIFEIHHNASLGKYSPENDEPLLTESTPDMTVTSAAQHLKKAVKCVCPNCNRGRILPSKFAPHLECCMGMKRNSSRIASQRIANTGKESSYIETMSDDDEDWQICSEKQKTSKKLDLKKKKTKKGPRPKASVPSDIAPINVESVDNLATLLSLDSSSRTWDTETNTCMYLTDSPLSRKKEKSKSKLKASTP